MLSYLRTHWLDVLATIAFIGLIAVASCMMNGCSRGGDGQPISSFTPKVYSQMDVSVLCAQSGVPIPTFLNSATYAQVRYTWLGDFQDRFRARLFRDGLQVNVQNGTTGWDATFDCYYLAAAFTYLSNVEYHSDARRTFGAPPGLAAVRVTYHPKGAAADHTLFLILTDRGAIWWDPQIGETKLLPVEAASIYRAEG